MRTMWIATFCEFLKDMRVQYAFEAQATGSTTFLCRGLFSIAGSCDQLWHYCLLFY